MVFFATDHQRPLLTHIRIHIRTHICTHICFHIRTHIRTHICTHIRTYEEPLWVIFCVQWASHSPYTRNSFTSLTKGGRDCLFDSSITTTE